MKCELNHIRLELSFPQMTLPSKSIWYWIQKGCHHWIFLDKEGFYAQMFQDFSLESGCGSASCWNKTAIAFFCALLSTNTIQTWAKDIFVMPWMFPTL